MDDRQGCLDLEQTKICVVFDEKSVWVLGISQGLKAGGLVASEIIGGLNRQVLIIEQDNRPGFHDIDSCNKDSMSAFFDCYYLFEQMQLLF